MAALTAVVIALTLAVAVNFLFLLAIVRRLRLQRPALRTPEMPAVGMQIPAFTVDDIEGHVVDDGFCVEHPDAVVGFFSETCAPCERIKIELITDPLQVPLLAFIHTMGASSGQSDFAKALAEIGARTVLLTSENNIPSRFSVSMFPTLMRVRNGIVVASSVKLADVRDRPPSDAQPSSDGARSRASDGRSEVAGAIRR